MQLAQGWSSGMLQNQRAWLPAPLMVSRDRHVCPYAHVYTQIHAYTCAQHVHKHTGAHAHRYTHTHAGSIWAQDCIWAAGTGPEV